MEKDIIKKLITMAVLVLCAGVVVFGLYNIVSIAIKEKAVESETQNEVDLFKERLEEGKISADESDSEKTISLKGSNNEDLDAVLIIESLDLEIPVKIAALYTDSEILHTYAGMFKEYGRPDKAGNNTVIAAHSSTRPVCPYCFFNKIGQLKLGDKLKLLYKNKITYEYTVTSILKEKNPFDETFYEETTGKDLLTLVTCTDGNSAYRTIIIAER